MLSAIISDETTFFKTLDLKKDYFSLPRVVNLRKYASVITHNGISIPSRCQFGLTRVRFQSMIKSLLRDYESFTYVYLDDILIYSKTKKEHIMHVKKVLNVSSHNCLFLNTHQSRLLQNHNLNFFVTV